MAELERPRVGLLIQLRHPLPFFPQHPHLPIDAPPKQHAAPPYSHNHPRTFTATVPLLLIATLLKVKRHNC